MRHVGLALIGLSGGMLIAGSFLALLCMIGILPRLAAITKTMKQAMLYESVMAAGAIFGNLVSLFSLFLGKMWILLLLYGFFGGVFIGCLAGALAEVVKNVPIFFRRLKLRKGQPYLVYSLAAGKLIGSFVQFFVLNG